MSRDENDAKICGDKTHRIVIDTGQMRQELRVAGKAVTPEEKRALVDWRGSDRVDLSGGAQFHGRFDVTAGSFSGGARLDSRLDVSLNVIEVKNYRLGSLIGKPLVAADDLVSTL